MTTFRCEVGEAICSLEDKENGNGKLGMDINIVVGMNVALMRMRNLKTSRIKGLRTVTVDQRASLTATCSATCTIWKLHRWFIHHASWPWPAHCFRSFSMHREAWCMINHLSKASVPFPFLCHSFGRLYSTPLHSSCWLVIFSRYSDSLSNIFPIVCATCKPCLSHPQLRWHPSPPLPPLQV